MTAVAFGMKEMCEDDEGYSFWLLIRKQRYDIRVAVR